METDAAKEKLLRTLRKLRLRMVMRKFLARAARATLFFYGILTGMTALAWYTGVLVPNLSGIQFMLAWPFFVGGLGALIITVLKIPPLRAVAATMDWFAGTCDRLLSALDFSTKPNPTEMERLAVEESAAWLKSRDFRPLLPIRPPSELRWLVIPLTTIALLWWSALDSIAKREAAVAAARDEVHGTVRQLEEMAKQFEQRRDDAKMKEIAERLRESAAQVRAEADKAGEANKAALRELAKLEQLVKELRRPEFATPEELKALSKALSEHEQTRDAAKDMAAGNLADAAKKLEQAAGDPKAAEQVEKTLQRAVNHLAERNEQVSKQLEKMQQNGEGGERQKLMQQLADALNELQQQQGKTAQQKQGKGKDAQPQQGGKPMTDEDLKRLLGALERMKEQQQGEGGEPGEPQEGEGEGQVEMLTFQPSEKPGSGGDDGPQFPTGNPGGEKDEGTTKDPFGKDAAPTADKGKDEQERGRLGEGESLSALIPSASAGDAKAQRRYKELTDAAAAAAEDVVLQEEIPLGSRHLIRRYFEAIRPK